MKRTCSSWWGYCGHPDQPGSKGWGPRSCWHWQEVVWPCRQYWNPPAIYSWPGEHKNMWHAVLLIFNIIQNITRLSSPVLGWPALGIWRSSTGSEWGEKAGSRAWTLPALWWSSSLTSAWIVALPGLPSHRPLPPQTRSLAPEASAPSGHSTPSPPWREGQTWALTPPSCTPGSRQRALGWWCRSRSARCHHPWQRRS